MTSTRVTLTSEELDVIEDALSYYSHTADMDPAYDDPDNREHNVAHRAAHVIAVRKIEMARMRVEKHL